MFTIHDGSRETLPARAQHRLHPQPGRGDRRVADGDRRLRRPADRAASSTLSGLEREVVGVTVSRFNDCAYSLAAHAKFARMQGGDEALVAALVAGEPLADERLEALRAFTLALLERARARDDRRPVARGGARGDRPGRLHDAGQLRRRRVGRADRRRLHGQLIGVRFVHVDKDGPLSWRKAAGRRVRPQLGAISDEARYRDRPSREDERGAGSPLPRRGTRVLDEQGAGSRG